MASVNYDLGEELEETGSPFSPTDQEELSMAHNLFRGQMAFVGHVPWHGLGKVVSSTVTAKDMCKVAGLDWDVTKEPAPGARIVNKQRGLHDRYLIMRDPGGEETNAVAPRNGRFGLRTASE